MANTYHVARFDKGAFNANTSEPVRTIYYSKRFTSGLLNGLTVTQTLTAEPSSLTHIRIGATGQDYGTRAKWIIVDASYQNYVR